jgi:hypothetical protein
MPSIEENAGPLADNYGCFPYLIWAETANGTDSDTVIYDPGCWSSVVVTIKEYLPFGLVAIPAVLRD